MTLTDYTWIDPAVIPDAAHLLHFSDIWCPVNIEGKVPVYKMGTRPNDANSLQGNRHKMIAEHAVANLEQIGIKTTVQHFDHIFLPDSPGRYV